MKPYDIPRPHYYLAMCYDYDVGSFPMELDLTKAKIY